MVSGEIGDMTGGKGCGALVARRQWRGPEHSRRLPPLPSAPMFSLPKRWTTKNDEKELNYFLVKRCDQVAPSYESLKTNSVCSPWEMKNTLSRKAKKNSLMSKILKRTEKGESVLIGGRKKSPNLVCI